MKSVFTQKIVFSQRQKIKYINLISVNFTNKYTNVIVNGTNIDKFSNMKKTIIEKKKRRKRLKFSCKIY